MVGSHYHLLCPFEFVCSNWKMEIVKVSLKANCVLYGAFSNSSFQNASNKEAKKKV